MRWTSFTRAFWASLSTSRHHIAAAIPILWGKAHQETILFGLVLARGFYKFWGHCSSRSILITPEGGFTSLSLLQQSFCHPTDPRQPSLQWNPASPAPSPWFQLAVLCLHPPWPDGSLGLSSPLPFLLGLHLLSALCLSHLVAPWCCVL